MPDYLTHYVAVKSSDKVTHIQLSVSHDKRRKCVGLSAYPAEAQESGTFVVRITQGKYLNGEPMARLSRAKLEAAFDKAKKEVEQKSGPAYNLVKSLCDESGLTLS